MTRIAFILWMLMYSAGVSSQEFHVLFRSVPSGNPDSILVTNLRTSQKVMLYRGDSLLLTADPSNKSYQYLRSETASLHPNPSGGVTRLRIFVLREEQVTVSIHNIKGQPLFSGVHSLQPGIHLFRIRFPHAGLYVVSVSGSDHTAGLKAISGHGEGGGSGVVYEGRTEADGEWQAFFRRYFYGRKSMLFNPGDILLCSAFSGRNNTILADSPVKRTVYEVEFHECLDAGNLSYPVVEIGNQWWMAANLAWLPSVNPLASGSETIPAYYVYGYDGTNVQAAKATTAYSGYGVLYNWAAVSQGDASPDHLPTGFRGACPAGWHVPADAEWTQMVDVLSGEVTAGGALKSTTAWNTPNTGATNRSGFTGLPGGSITGNVFLGFGNSVGFWSSTGNQTSEAWYRKLDHLSSGIARFSSSRQNAFSLRCVKSVPTAASVVTAKATGLTWSYVIGGGIVTFDGYNQVTERGIVLSTRENPTVQDRKVAMGSGTGSYSDTIKGLSGNTSYYLRAYAINTLGVVYGEQVTFTTPSEINLPAVTTQSASGISQEFATVGGTVVNDGNTPVTERGICWNTTGNPTVADSKTIMGSGTGNFSVALTGLKTETKYYAAAWATNSVGTAYGNTVTFTTLPPPTLPVVITELTGIISLNGVILGGNVTLDGYTPVTERGVVYALHNMPSLTDNRVPMGNGAGSFLDTVKGLTPYVTYYARAYAINKIGMAYGNLVTFIPFPVVDADGNGYRTVVTGNQEWLAENLKTTRYSDGTPIPSVTDNYTWNALTTGAFSWYNNDEKNKDPLGALYNWYAVNNPLGLCPKGWHVPTHNDWQVLVTFLGDSAVAGGKLKESGTLNWSAPNTGATNSAGFNALPGGIRGGYGEFYNKGFVGYWWSATSYNAGNALFRSLYHNAEDMATGPYPKPFGFSVRCLKDP